LTFPTQNPPSPSSAHALAAQVTATVSVLASDDPRHLLITGAQLDAIAALAQSNAARCGA